MTPYGYIIMIIVDSCMIWFHFDCIMQLKISYHIATNVCSRKSATNFGDLPDWLMRQPRSNHVRYTNVTNIITRFNELSFLFCF